MYLLDRTSATIDTPDKALLDRELTPILAELVTLGPGNSQHPTARQLFNWLVDPQRTGEEYAYVVGELADNVSFVMEEHFLDYVYEEDYSGSLCNVAAEALAMKCPVLEGAWEQATWTLIVAIENKLDFSEASNRLSSWIIHIIGDPDLCPNPYLRIELMILLARMVKYDDYNQAQVIESVLSACSSYNIDYATDNLLEFHQNHAIESVLSIGSSFNIDYLSSDLLNLNQIEVPLIINIFEELAKDGYHLLKFDTKLAKKLLDVKLSRCSTLIHDVRYLHAVTPSRCTEPRVLYGLIALLDTTDGLMQLIYKDIQSKNYDQTTIVHRIKEQADVLYGLIRYFNASCQTTQLVGLTASCIMDLIRLVTKVNIELNDNIDGFHFMLSLKRIDQVLQLLFHGKDVPTSTPVGQEMVHSKHIDNISGLIYYYDNFNNLLMMRNVIDDLCFFCI